MRFPNGKSFSTYRVVFPELVGDGKIPMQIAEFESYQKLEGSPVDNLSKEATKLLGQIDEVRAKKFATLFLGLTWYPVKTGGPEWCLTARRCPTPRLDE